MKTLNEIESILRKHKKELKEKYYISEIGIFGSYVRGEQNENSDVDILVEFYPKSVISLLDVSSLKNYISDLLHMKVDVIHKKDIRIELKKNILNEAIYL
ncbi:MAG: nucleotidyltransferase family protein [bacterium]